MTHPLRALASTAVLMCLASCARATEEPARPGFLVPGPLVSSRATMVTAWEFPRNPLTDPTLDNSPLSNEIRRGFRIFTNTRAEAARFTPSRMSCNNCHLNGGQREKSLPLVGITGMFPAERCGPTTCSAGWPTAASVAVG